MSHAQISSPEETLRNFFVEALSFEEWITQELGQRWRPLFRAIRSRVGRIRFSDEQSHAAFYIDAVTGDFVFFNAGFDALASAMLQIVGSGLVTGQAAYLVGIAHISYGLHEILHPEQGLSEFSVVQKHKKVPSGYDEIGKIDHIADNCGISLMAAVHAARVGDLSRVSYLQQFRNLSYLVNRAAPIAFDVPDSALHKQKRRLMNWLVFERVDDALRHDMIAEIESQVGPVDAPLWIHFQIKSGDVILWEPQPVHRVLSSTRVHPSILRRALEYREHMDGGRLVMPWRAFLRALQVDAAAVKAKSKQSASPSQTL
jgi:hypothetical protein